MSQQNNLNQLEEKLIFPEKGIDVERYMKANEIKNSNKKASNDSREVQSDSSKMKLYCVLFMGGTALFVINFLM